VRLYRLLRANQLIFVGIGVAILYWIVESYLDTMILEVDFTSRLFPEDPNELWMRLLIVGLLVGFSIYVQALISRRRRAEEALREARDELEVRVEERTAELTQTNETLRVSEERYRMLVESVKDYAIFLVDTEGRVAHWNAGAERLYGYGEEEILGEDGSLLFTPEDRRRGTPQEELSRAQTEGRSQDERWHMRKDGNHFWASGFVRPVRDEAGNLRGFAKVARDITERKRAEEALKEQQEFLRQVLDTNPNLVFVKDWDGKFTLVNKAVADIYGTTAAELVGKSDADFNNNQEEVEAFLRADREVMETLQSKYILEEPVTDSRTSEVRWFQTIKVPLVPSTDGSRRVLGVSTDITELRQAKEAIRESEERYRAVVEQSAEGIYLIDATTKRVIETNPSLQQLLGYTAGELRGMELYALVAHPREEVDANLRRTLKEKRHLIGDTKYRRKDGTLLDVEVVASVIRYGGREVVCAVVRDITERKRAEEALRQVREAERKRMARDLHDGALQDISYALSEGEVARILPDDPERATRLERVVGALQRAMHGLRVAVNDLRVEEGQNRSLPRLLESLVGQSRQRAADQYISLEVEEGFPSTPFGEAGVELLRIIQEALTNARRHSGARNVVVTLRAEGEELVAEVTDDGRGFGPGSSPGVGMRSMRERAASLGGTLEIDSEAGEGTTVRLRAPLPQPTRPPTWGM
jgi:PAS domain S-box-containing protein